jgi:hypothetical protein
MHLCRVALIGLQAAALFAVLSASAQTQSQPTAAVHALPSDAELDGLLAARKWNDLGAALSNLDNPVSFARSMDWLHSRLDRGGGMLLGLLYARDLWATGKSQAVADPAEDMRVTAGMITLYTFELIAIDGAKCEDKSAPGHRVEQLFAARRETLAFLKQLPHEWKDNVVKIAIALEKKTADLRGEDDLICRGGLEEYQAALEHGKTVDAQLPAGWAPKFAAPSVYQPLQTRVRAEMQSTLLKVIE